MSSYLLESKYVEERQIRRFELTNLINSDNSEFLKKFSWIYPMICFDSDSFNAESNIENILKDNFNPDLFKLIKNGNYFKCESHGKTIYDIQKIRILVFLLTTNSNEVNYSDKGCFMISIIKESQNDALEETIVYSQVLAEIVQILFEISCIEIYKFYIAESQTNLTNQIIKMTGVKEKCIQEIFKRIFGFDKSKNTNFNTIEAEKFLDLFKKNSIFLTSGYIREIAFDELADQGLVIRPKKCCTIF